LAAIIFGQAELLSNKSNQWRSVRLLFGEGVLETSHDENMPLTVKKRRRKKEKKNTKTFTFTTLLNHVILRDDQPILMIDLRTI
jgi:hypothetical protein